ncbi:MAG: hypothetical protein J6B30_05685 [Muribaculaceae bacterium]|nr:hypothetical protein [Muribaculaceae bacterium]
MNEENDYLIIDDKSELPHRTETLRLDQSHIEVADVYSVEEGGKVTTYTDAEIDYTEAIFVDIESDGEIDYVVYDVNHDGVLEEGEEFLIEDGHLYQSDLDDMYLDQQFGYDDLCETNDTDFF